MHTQAFMSKTADLFIIYFYFFRNMISYMIMKASVVLLMIRMKELGQPLISGTFPFLQGQRELEFERDSYR